VRRLDHRHVKARRWLCCRPKATSPGWTGVHEPHTKLSDVLARHKNHADRAETIVDDMNGFAYQAHMYEAD
jgi:hypothetical protein